MIGPMLPDFGSSKFFKSEIIQNEVARLQEDHKTLGELGTRYKVSPVQKLLHAHAFF